MLFARQYDDAIRQLNTAIDLNPNYWFDYLFLGRAYQAKGEFAEAGARKRANQ